MAWNVVLKIFLVIMAVIIAAVAIFMPEDLWIWIAACGICAALFAPFFYIPRSKRSYSQ